MKEVIISENSTALELVIAGESALDHEQKAQKWRNEVKEMLKDKELQITRKILDKLVDAGYNRSNLDVTTTILLRKAIVRIQRWNFGVEYRDGDLIISMSSEKKCDVKLSEMNTIFNIITEVINKEGLQ